MQGFVSAQKQQWTPDQQRTAGALRSIRGTAVEFG
jgi:hypothetical protein